MPTEQAVRHRAKRIGLRIQKERNRNYPGDRYMILDEGRRIVAGCDHGIPYTMDLDDVDDWLSRQ